MAVLRKREFLSLHEINVAIKECLVKLNTKPFKKRPGSRLSIFTNSEKSCLQNLPEERFEIEDWNVVTVGRDYHVDLLDGSSYSVPCHLTQKRVDVCQRKHFVEILFKGKRVAFHERKAAEERSTQRAHMPASHQAYAEMNREDIERLAMEISETTKKYVIEIMMRAQCLQKGVKTASGILHIAEKISKEIFVNSCEKALQLRAYTKSDFLRIVSTFADKSDGKLIKNGTLERQNEPWHENIRGPAAYRCDDNFEHDDLSDPATTSRIT